MYRSQVNVEETIFTVESMHAGPYSSVTDIETFECKLAFDCNKGEKVFYKLKKDCSCYKDKFRYEINRRSWWQLVTDMCWWQILDQKFSDITLICNNVFQNWWTTLFKLVNGYLYIESDYHTVNYTESFLDVWMFTNSTEIILHHVMDRNGSILWATWNQNSLLKVFKTPVNLSLFK